MITGAAEFGILIFLCCCGYAVVLWARQRFVGSKAPPRDP